MPRLCCIFGSVICLTGVFISQYAQSFYHIALSYGVCYGFGIGTVYLPPLICAWEYFPNRKGIISGIIVGGFGLGSFIFSLVA